MLVPSAQMSIAEEVLALLVQESVHLQVHFRQMPGTDLLSIAHAVHQEGGGILAIGGSVCSAETIKQLLRRLDIPILLVR